MYTLVIHLIAALGHVAQRLLGQPALHMGGIGLLPQDYRAPVTQGLSLIFSALTKDRPDNTEEPSLT